LQAAQGSTTTGFCARGDEGDVTGYRNQSIQLAVSDILSLSRTRKMLSLVITFLSED
jgi:hypothetical protein